MTNEVTSSREETYGYDDLSRLGSVNYGDGQTQSYTFDAMGNRLSKQDSASGTTNSVYNAANMLTGTTGAGASTYTSDADGDTLSGGGRTETWDSQNRMTSCVNGSTTSTFTYGFDGLRRSMTTGGVTTNYCNDGYSDSAMMVREMQVNPSTGSLVSTATYFIGTRGPEYRRNDTQTEGDGQGHIFGKTRWYVYDGLGSVLGEVDPLGNLTCANEYDVYGNIRGRTGTATTEQGFVGQLGHLSDASTGLIYMRARYMDPTTGRFVSEDPALNGTNWFVYAGANPVNCVDSTGKDNIWLEGGAALMGLACLTAAFLSPMPIAIDYAVKACAWLGAAIAFGATDKMPAGIAEIGALLAVGAAYFKDIASMIVATKLAQNFGIAELDVVLVAACAEGFTLIGEMAYQDAGL